MPDDQRRRNRDGSSCPTPETEPGTWIAPPRRPVPKCDPPTPPAVETFQTPEPGVFSAVPLRAPDGLLYGSQATTVTCAADWPLNVEGQASASGTDRTLPAGAVTGSFLFQSVTILTAAELDFVSRVAVSDEAGIRAALGGGQVAALRQILNLSEIKAQAVLDAFEAFLEQLNESARQTAISQLECSWKSAQVNLQCSAGADTYNEELTVTAASLGLTSHSLTLVGFSDARGIWSSDGSAAPAPSGIWVRLSVHDGVWRIAKFQDGVPDDHVDAQGAEEDPSTADWNSAAVVQVDRTSPGNPVVLPSGFRESPNSQAEADSLAADEANLRLRCQWSSAAVDVTCGSAGLAVLAPGAPDPVTGGTVPDTTVAAGWDDPENANAPLINRIILGEGARLSFESQEAADELANLLAISQLNCFFRNAEQTRDCEDLDGVADRTVNPVTFDGASRGNPVTVPPGNTRSSVSQAEADQAARDLADSFLVCEYLNDELTYACDDLASDPTDPDQVALHVAGTYPGAYEPTNKAGQVIYVNALGTNVALMASPQPSVSPLYAVTVAAGGGSPSTISKQAANEMAALIALSRLQCTYCNPLMAPVCALPDQSSLDYTPGLPGVLYEAQTDPEAPWRPVASFFNPSNPAPESYYCSSDPTAAVATADSLALIPERLRTPASRNDNCRFGNVRMFFACEPRFLPSPISEGAQVVTVGGDNTFGPSSFSGYVLIEANSFQGSTLAEANAIAQASGLSQLDCFYQGSHTAACAAAFDNRGSYLWGGIRNAASEPTLYLKQGFTPADANAWQTTPPTFTATASSYVSQADADTQAEAAAKAGLVCLYGNYGRFAQSFCVNGENPANAGFVVALGATPSEEGPQSANIMAESLVMLGSQCHSTNGFEIVMAGGAGSVNGGPVIVDCSTLDCFSDLSPGHLLQASGIAFSAPVPQNVNTSFWLVVTCSGGSPQATIQQHPHSGGLGYPALPAALDNEGTMARCIGVVSNGVKRQFIEGHATLTNCSGGGGGGYSGPFALSTATVNDNLVLRISGGEVTNNGSGIPAQEEAQEVAEFEDQLASGTSYAFVKVTRAEINREVQSVEAGMATSLEDLAGSKTEQFIRLGRVVVQSISGSLQVQELVQEWHGNIFNYETFGSSGDSWYYHYFVSAAGGVIPFDPPPAP